MTDDATLLLVRDPRFRDHDPHERHPECPERLDAIDRALVGLEGSFRELAPRAADADELLRAHSAAHLDRLERARGQRAKLDPDTYTSERSIAVACLAAGATIDLALRVARGEARSGFALVRPPGHHAERSRAMGFCLLNHVALAAHALRDTLGLERIAIVDWDVHHGNGTQEIFAGDRDLLYLSLHQYPWYPGTGALDERGLGDGEGATVNLPLPAGCGDAEYGAAFDAVVVPTLHAFAPELILVSAGFDAHERDPLSSMQVSSGAFARFAAQLRTVADDVCGGRLVLALEGGYDLAALGEAVAQVTQTLAAPVVSDFHHPSGTKRANELVEMFREAHGSHWPGLRPVTSITG